VLEFVVEGRSVAIVALSSGQRAPAAAARDAAHEERERNAAMTGAPATCDRIRDFGSGDAGPAAPRK
jgi:hypothetical protein